MAKLGKKARKFARKNLPSLLKRQRKLKSKYKRKAAAKGGNDAMDEQSRDAAATRRKPLIEDVEDASLDIFSSEEDDDMVEEGSESDGFLSEDSSCSHGVGIETEVDSEDTSQNSKLSIQNEKIVTELAEKKDRLEALKQKDPQFVVFLQDHIKNHEALDNDEMLDEDEMSDDDIQPVNSIIASSNTGRLLNSSTFNNWCQIVKEQHKWSVLPSLLNAYRAASHYGADSTDANASTASLVIQDRETYCSILMFMLSEGDNLFRTLLGISSSKMKTIQTLKNSSKWGSVKPMIKSYLKSTLFLLNQISDSDILAYALTRLRASLIFFSAFPYLQSRLTEVSVHLWATGGGVLSSCSFLILCDMASLFGDDFYDKCLKKTYRTIASRCKVVDPASLKHIEYLKNSFIEICSIDLRRSFELASTSIQKLATIVKLGLQTKTEEALKKISSWEYTLCIDLWVMFVSVNIKDNDLHGLLSTLIQIINGVTRLFASQRYLPLRVKCIQWLNRLSSSSEVFIPVSAMVLDILESSEAMEVGKPGKGGVNFSTTVKLPKHCLKSQEFQEECVSAAIELLSAHFLQWNHHISFPELSTIPIIRMKQFHEKSTVEHLRRMVKRLIDQVEKNVDFVQRKRDDVSFSPKDQEFVNTFLQIEKHSDNSPFIQYYNSMIQNAATRKFCANGQPSMTKQKNLKGRKRKLPQKTVDGSVNGEKEPGKTSVDPSTRSQQGMKRKKLRT